MRKALLKRSTGSTCANPADVTQVSAAAVASTTRRATSGQL
jgi:hypothetical protein